MSKPFLTREAWLAQQGALGMNIDAQLRSGLGPVRCDDCDYDQCSGWVWGDVVNEQPRWWRVGRRWVYAVNPSLVPLDGHSKEPT